jgi:ABC-type phosphate/phosphonate transport system substrate-binding protein
LKQNVINTSFGAFNKEADRIKESELQIVFAERVSNMQEGETIASITNELIQASKKPLVKPVYAADYNTYLQAVAPNSDLYKALESGTITDAEADSIAEGLNSYFNSVDAYNSFREDYDSIMKGL